MTTISQDDVIRCKVALRTPFTVVELPFLSRLHMAAFRHRRRLSKRFVGKPAKKLFRFLLSSGASGQGRVRLTGGAEIAFNARNTQFGALYLPQNQPVYEAETSALLERLAAPDAVFYDIGANWGWYSVLLATRPGFSGQVHAFEPFPPTFQDLRAVVGQAGLDGVIHCHDVALADREGVADMAPSDGVQSGLARLGEGGGMQVRLTRLDAMGLPDPDTIKVDAEDHELEVLQGAADTIARARPFIVFENWLHRDDPDLTLAPIRFLAERGYRFFFPGWADAKAVDCILAGHAAPQGPEPILALVPFLADQRFLLPSQLNIVAVPAERIDVFKSRFHD